MAVRVVSPVDPKNYRHQQLPFAPPTRSPSSNAARPRSLAPRPTPVAEPADTDSHQGSTLDVEDFAAEERAVIERICRSVGPVRGPAAYARCVEEGKQNRPDFRGLSVTERTTIERMCRSVGPVRGPAAYAAASRKANRIVPIFKA